MEKDDLYYQDLDYAIRKFAGIFLPLNTQTEKRIYSRSASTLVTINGVNSYHFSDFQLDIFDVIGRINKEVSENNIDRHDSAVYQKLVNDILKDVVTRDANQKVKKI